MFSHFNANPSSSSSSRNSNSNKTKKPLNEFLVKNAKQVSVSMDGDANIPFAALKESFRYKAFVTNLSPSCSVDAIKGHVNSKLGVNAVIKPVSPAGAPYLSLILLCTSESDKLDLRMAGLWLRGTIV